mmetsp:Transcript_53047/g.152893  ORF Transcript_53047/g.152893 Transcript_53047/m.152893 type:complete len:212 (-) Transcript_53047:406-1041(-)
MSADQWLNDLRRHPRGTVAQAQLTVGIQAPRERAAVRHDHDGVRPTRRYRDGLGRDGLQHLGLVRRWRLPSDAQLPARVLPPRHALAATRAREDVPLAAAHLHDVEGRDPGGEAGHGLDLGGLPCLALERLAPSVHIAALRDGDRVVRACGHIPHPLPTQGGQRGELRRVSRPAVAEATEGRGAPRVHGALVREDDLVPVTDSDLSDAAFN